MPGIFWSGKLSLPVASMVNANNFLAWLTGNARDTAAMKNRVRQGYEGAFSEHASRYDELAAEMQRKAAAVRLEGVDVEGVDVEGKEVLDVGCGTAILSLLALKKGAAKEVCGDISVYRLQLGRAKAARQGYGADRIEFRQLDVESLPFEDSSFDFVMTGMTLGMLPEPEKAVAEMVRVLRPGGFLSVGAHGPEHYWEACDACFRVISKRYVLGHRLEFWSRKGEEVERLLSKSGLIDIRTSRITGRNTFKTGGEAYDFFSAISATWWYGKVPPNKRAEETEKTRDYFQCKGIRQVTDDVILAYGRKS